MRNICLKLLYAVSFLSFAVMATPEAEALTNIPNNTTVTAPPQADDAMNFSSGPPGGTFVIDSGVTFTGAITSTGGAVWGTLVLNQGSQLNGAVGNPAILQVTLDGNATIIGATGAQNFNLGQNTLTNTGALNLPSGVVINTRVVSNALFGQINASGADSISGASVQVNVDASGVIALTPGQPLFVISAAGTTSGLPVNVTSNNVLYSFIGNNLNGNITITPTLNPAVGSSLPGGVGAVFTALLTVAANNPGSDIAAVVAAISALPTAAAIKNALLQLNPNVEGAIPEVSFNAMKQFTNLWTKHMGYGRCVYATDCDDGCCQPEKPKQNNCECFAEANCENVCNNYEVWVDGFAYGGHQDARKGFRSYNAQIYGGMIGFQAPVSQEVSVGLGTGYAHSHVHRKEGNNTNIQTYDATAYVSYDPTNWYVDGAVSFDYNRYRDARHIRFDDINRTAKASYGGQQYSAFVAAGYRYYNRWCGIITPIAGLQYSCIHVNPYHEHGAGDLDLHVQHQTYNFLESSLGLKFSKLIQTCRGAFVPEIHALWLHDFFGDDMSLKTTFSGVATEAGTFKTKGPAQDRNWGDVGISLSFISCMKLAVQLAYNFEFSRNYHSNEGLIKITQRF